MPTKTTSKRELIEPHTDDKRYVRRKADGTFEWAAMGRGIIDFVGQFRALAQAGYSGTMSLETHWRGAGSPEESSRQSWAGMKELLGEAGALGQA